MNIVLTGFMGTGKTVIGKLLAEKLSWEYIDTDELIEKKEASARKLLDCLSILEKELEHRRKLFQSVDIGDIDGKFARYCLSLLRKNEN